MGRPNPLPVDPIERSITLVRNSLPNARQPAPDLPKDALEQLLEARNLRAETFASMEDMTDRCRRLAEDMDETGIIVDVLDGDEEDSLVHHITELGVAGGSR